jgi:D-3-phosphoglycerate dehydrogenase / 2-oxoglutarate reductase
LDALKGRPVRNAVNMVTLDIGDAEKLKPYIRLAEKLGNVHGQLVDGHVTDINIDYNGDIVNHPTEIISVAVQKGLLQSFLGDNVNYVNAALLCRERGIKLSETKSIEIEDFVNLITVTVKTDKGEKRISGAIFGTKEPRIVEIDDYHVDAMASGYLLILLTQKDKPGVMGSLGNILGEHNINIAGMSLGRERPNDEAIAILTLDSPVPKEALEKIKTLGSIFEAKLVRLD